MIEQLNTITTIEIDAQVTVIEHVEVQLMEIATTGPQGAIGPQGPQGEQGPPGGGFSYFEQELSGLASQLQVEHNLGRLLVKAKVISLTGVVSSVHIDNKDANGNLSTNSALVTSSVPMAGKLILI